ncbi:MAG: ABC transporter permease [Ardenticatenaceae bacterium]|nr:ABC transporter permease [Ardenticatenaceae bacterium]
MNRIATLIKQDLLLSWRNGLVISTAVLLVIMGACIYLLPESFDVETAEFVYDASSDKAYETFLRQNGLSNANFVESEDELVAVLNDANQGFGVIYEGPVDDPRITLLTVGNLAEENINVALATLDYSAAVMQGKTLPDQYQIRLLRPPSEPVPVNLNFIPIAIVFEVVLLGFMFGAVMIFEEKQEGINRALRVSPMSTMDYIWSKNILFLAMGLIYGGVLIFLALQFRADYGRILLLIALTTSMMTFVGLGIAVFFNNISEWFFIGVGVLIVFNLPVISYALPTFMPGWITWIPSFPILFGVREILFPTGQTGFYLPLVVQLVIYNLIAFGFGYLAVDRKLMKAG